MKNHFNSLFIIFLLISASTVFAQQQDITGVWKGLLYVDSTRAYLPYEIAISEQKNKMTGYSRIIFIENGKEEAGYEDLDIKWKGNQVVVEDRGFFEHSFTMKVVKRIKKTLLLSLTVSDTDMVLKGNWSTNRTRFYLAATGSVELKRKTAYKETALYKKLDTLKLAPKLFFTYTEKIPEPAIVAAAPEKKKADPDLAIMEEELPILASLPNAGAINVLPINKNKRASIAKVEPLDKNKKALFASLTRMKVNYTPKPEPPAVAIVTPKPVKKELPAAVEKPVAKETVAIKPAAISAPPVAKPAPPPIVIIAPSITKGAAEIEKRITKSDQSFYFESDSLLLTLYDNGEVDGDTVTVLMNGNIIFSKQGLNTKANTKTVYITSAMDSVNLVMYAESLGEIPPNTGLLIVNDGEKRYDVRFSADLKTNAGIILRRRKKTTEN